MALEDLKHAPRKVAVALLGISTQHFSRLKTAGVVAPNPDNTYDLTRLVSDWTKYQIAGANPGSMADEKLKLVKAQRRKLEVETRERTRELVPHTDAAAAFSEAMVLVAGQLDALPGRAAGELAGLSDPAVIRSWLFNETRRIRDAAARRLEDFASDPAGIGATVTTSTEDSGSVG